MNSGVKLYLFTEARVKDAFIKSGAVDECDSILNDQRGNLETKLLNIRKMRKKMMIKNLRLIKGGKKEKLAINYEGIYLNAMIKVMVEKEEDPSNKDIWKKFIYHTFKYFEVVDIKWMNEENLERLMVLNDVMKNWLKELTPAEFMTIFSPEKIYDGRKYQTKDYFTTMAALNEHGLNKPIGTRESASDLLWDYMNTSVMKYQIKMLKIISKLSKAQTGKDLIERAIEDNVIDIKVYHKNTDHTGKTFLLDGNGNSIPVSKSAPRYLKLMKYGA